MNNENKIKNVADKVVGSIKEGTGKLTDNPELELKGKIQKAEGKSKEKLTDTLDNIKDKTADVKDDVLTKINKTIDKKKD